MRKSKYKYMRYLITVLAYYRCEWTDVSRDEDFKVAVTQELSQLVYDCYQKKTSVPNAAKEISLFFQLMERA